MPSLDCFSYIQRGSSPLVLVDFCGFLGFCFPFFPVMLFCSTVHLIRMHHQQQGNTVPPALCLLPRAPWTLGPQGGLRDWPAPGESRGARGPLRGRDCLHAQPWPAPPLSLSTHPRTPTSNPCTLIPPLRGPMDPLLSPVPSATSLPHQRWLPSTTPCAYCP